MSKKLPTDCFKSVIDVSKIGEDNDNDNDIGYILKVNIEYPKELHDLHSDLTFIVCTLYDKKTTLSI